MPTTKKRLNITLDSDTEKAINALSKHRNQPQATLTANLVREALELQEDFALAKIAESRMKNHKGRWLSHEEVWGK